MDRLRSSCRAVGLWIASACLMYAVVASTLGLCLCLKFSALRAGLHQPQTSIDNRLRRDLESSLALAIPISMIGGIVLAVVIYDTRSGTAS